MLDLLDAERAVSDIEARARDIGAAHNKRALAKAARAIGWRGDDARTPAGELALWLAKREHEGNPLDLETTEEQREQPAATVAPAADPAAMIAQAMRALLATMPAQLDEARVRAIVGECAPQGIDADEVRAIVAQAIAGIPPARLEVHHGQVRTIEGRTHAAFGKVCKLVAAGVNVMLKGPAATGKTTLAHQVAQALGRDFGAIHCSAGMSESQLLGWRLPAASGEWTYYPATFARLYKAGNAVFLADEGDAADPNTWLVLNGALANGHLHVPQNIEEPTIARGAGFSMLVACNTFGTGADAQYVGRMQLDAATLDRFYIVEMDYDRELEAQLGPREICEWVWSLRERADRAKLRRTVSTRMIQRMAAALGAGLDMAEAKRDALAGWRDDELSKVGEVRA